MERHDLSILPPVDDGLERQVRLLAVAVPEVHVVVRLRYEVHEEDPPLRAVELDRPDLLALHVEQGPAVVAVYDELGVAEQRPDYALVVLQRVLDDEELADEHVQQDSLEI